MNIVVLSTCTPTNAYLIRSIAERHLVSHVFRVTWPEPAQSSSRLTKFLRSPIGSVSECARRKYLERSYDRREREAMSHLACTDHTLGNIPTTSVDIGQVNASAFAAELRRRQPDVLLVTAGPILKPRIFEIPRLATLNVHRGIAPAYRGERTLFWALANNDFDNIGVTLHRIDRGVDTGPVLKYGYPALASQDTEASITAKSMQLAAEMVGDALDEAASTNLEGATQPSIGRCFYARDQRIWREAYFQLMRRLGRRRVRTREQRIVTLTPCPPEPSRPVECLSDQLATPFAQAISWT